MLLSTNGWARHIVSADWIMTGWIARVCAACWSSRFMASISRASTSQQVKVIKRKYEEELQEGDLVFFDYDGKKFSHVGVYLQNGYYVHASSTKGVIIVKLHDPYTYKYFSRCGSVMALIQIIARNSLKAAGSRSIQFIIHPINCLTLSYYA